MLILTFKGEDAIMDEMEAQCGKLGPACMAYLEGLYNSTGLAAAINNLGAVVREAVIGRIKSPGSQRATSASRGSSS
eukprot:6506094-Prymnesium_polylepis.1